MSIMLATSLCVNLMLEVTLRACSLYLVYITEILHPYVLKGKTKAFCDDDWSW